MEFRIGINLGDVMVEGDQIYGDGINVAARLESLADPGGICISGTVYEQVGRSSRCYQDIGEQTVKNIAAPVRVFRVLPDGHGEQGKEPAYQTPIFAGGRVVVGRAGDHRWDDRGRATCLVQPPHFRLDSARPHPALSLPDKPSIAVLPFTNVSGDPPQEYFSDGVTDELITDLSKLPGLFVIARTSAFTYKGGTVKVQEVSRDWEFGMYWRAACARRPTQYVSPCSWWMGPPHQRPPRRLAWRRQ